MEFAGASLVQNLGTVACGLNLEAKLNGWEF